MFDLDLARRLEIDSSHFKLYAIRGCERIEEPNYYQTAISYVLGDEIGEVTICVSAQPPKLNDFKRLAMENAEKNETRTLN